MNKYTVVLLRPEYLSGPDGTGEPYGLDTYVALVSEVSISAAITVAQFEVFSGDKKDKLAPKSPVDYKMLNVFAGHQHPLAWSWSS